MKEIKDYRPRLTVEISEEQQRRLRNGVRWGLIKPLFSAIIDDVLDLIDKKGEVVVMAIVNKEISILDLLPILEERRKLNAARTS